MQLDDLALRIWTTSLTTNRTTISPQTQRWLTGRNSLVKIFPSTKLQEISDWVFTHCWDLMRKHKWNKQNHFWVEVYHNSNAIHDWTMKTVPNLQLKRVLHLTCVCLALTCDIDRRFFHQNFVKVDSQDSPQSVQTNGTWYYWVHFNAASLKHHCVDGNRLSIPKLLTHFVTQLYDNNSIPSNLSPSKQHFSPRMNAVK